MQQTLYKNAVAQFGVALDRLAVGYEADRDKRRDLRQEIHFQLWRSLELFDHRCSLQTWTFRVAHNTAASYVDRERRRNFPLISLEDVENTPIQNPCNSDFDMQRALKRLSNLIHKLKPLDRQIMLSYLEEMDAGAIAEITGLSAANVSMKIHRIKIVLARHFHREREHA